MNHWRTTLSLGVYLVFFAYPILAQMTLGPFPPLQGLVGAGAVWTDVDEDGFEDLVAIGVDTFDTARNAVVIFDTSTAQFVEVPGPFQGLRNGDLVASDFTGDGWEDLFLLGEKQDGNAFSGLYTKTGSSNYALQITGIPAFYEGRVMAGDFEGDGDQDLFIGGFTPQEGPLLAIFLNDGLGNFTRKADSLPQLLSYQLDWRDQDGDGDLDLLVQGNTLFGQFKSYFFRNDWPNGLTSIESTAMLQKGSGCICWLDTDGDNRMEILESGSGNGAPTLQIWQEAYPQFQNIAHSIEGFGHCGVAIAPNNLNSGPGSDFVISGHTANGYKLKVITDNGSGGFNTLISIPGMEFAKVDWGDFNADGLPDFVVYGVSPTSPGIWVFRNTGTTFVRHQ